MEPFRYHVFVCTQEKPEGVQSCSSCGSQQVLGSLYQQLHAQGMGDEVQVTTSGCLGLCDDAPLMIAYPEGTWYRKVKPADVQEIVKSHFVAGKALSRLEWADAPAMKAAAQEHTQRYHAMVKAKDEAGTLPDDINDLIRGFMPSRAVLSAIELNLFTAVDSGSTASGVAERAGTDRESNGDAAEHAGQPSVAREERSSLPEHAAQCAVPGRWGPRQCAGSDDPYRELVAALVRTDRVRAHRKACRP